MRNCRCRDDQGLMKRFSYQSVAFAGFGGVGSTELMTKGGCACSYLIFFLGGRRSVEKLWKLGGFSRHDVGRGESVAVQYAEFGGVMGRMVRRPRGLLEE